MVHGSRYKKIMFYFCSSSTHQSSELEISHRDPFSFHKDEIV